MLAEIEAIGTVIGSFILLFSLPTNNINGIIISVVIFVVSIIALAINGGKKNGK